MSALKGYRTYILAVLGIIAVWLDHFFGIGLSSQCTATAIDCTITLTQAIAATWAALMAIAIRAGINSAIVNFVDGIVQPIIKKEETKTITTTIVTPTPPPVV